MADKLPPVPDSHCLSNYTFNAKLPLERRVSTLPLFLFQELKLMDHRVDYRRYDPSVAEQATIKDCLAKLPPRHQRVLREKLVAIYFLKNFQSAGLTDWVLDDKTNVFCHMIFNPQVLKWNIAETLAWKERTCFSAEGSPFQLKIEAASQSPGLLYILLHEATHVVDYAEKITPFVENSRYAGYLKRPAPSPFTNGFWLNYDTPLKDYSLRQRVTFYGFNDGPKLSLNEAPQLYAGLQQSGFASLYASLNWADDLAELTAFYHLTQKLKQPYRIKILRGATEVLSYEPMQSPRVRARFGSLAQFY